MMDNDYNRRLANNLSQINYSLSKKDVLTDTIGKKGGAVSKYRTNEEKNMYVQDLASVGDKYIKSGSVASYPMMNMSELQRLDRERSNPLYYQKLTNAQLKGGISLQDIGNFFKPIGSAILDVGAPAVGAMLGGPMGAVAAKAVREGVRGVSGVGLKRGKKAGAKTAGVGTYKSGSKSGGKLSPEIKAARVEAKAAAKEARAAVKAAAKEAKAAAKEARAASKPVKVKSDKPKRKVSGAVNERAKIVKSVMKDMGMKMIDASSYVKKHNLYKK